MFIFSAIRIYSLLVVLAFISISVCVLTGCSGTSPGENPDVPDVVQPIAAELFALPQIPTGDADVRQGTTVDNDNVQGAGFMDSFGATIDGSAVTLEAGTTPADITAFSIYQHVARPDPAVPFMLSVIGYYQDVDPTDIDPTEGYYVLYADYNQNRWVTAGFYKTTTTRVEIPGAANVVSPSGFIYTAVVAYDGNSVRVTNVKVGYDEGPGYEQYVLPEVPGLSVGRLCDIELDEAGVPQIAYMVGSSLIETRDAFIRVARMVGDVWETQDITTIGDPVFFDFAIGSAGRRALIVYDNYSHQYLLLDTGSGEFTVEYNSDGGGIFNGPITNIDPSITYINGTDDPLGELDTVVSLYAIPNGMSDITIQYLRADGVAPLSEGTLIGGASLKVRDLSITTFSDNRARAAIPVNGLVESDCMFSTYDAVIDGWGPSGINVWEELYLGTSDYEGVILREFPIGDVAACYRSGEEGALVFGVWDGVTWTSNPSDHVSCNPTPSEKAVDFETNTPGFVGFPTVYGNYSPVVYYGDVGNATPFDPYYLNNEPLSCGDISLAIDDSDLMHLAWERPMDGQLVYSTMESGELGEQQVVDYGADGNAMGFGPAPIVADGDRLHVFHLDYAHGQIVYSRNVAGTWEEEQKPILPIPQYPYLLSQAGVLEDTGEVYVSYLDYFDTVWRVLISDPTQETWRVVDVAPFWTEYFYLADDENSISVAYYIENLFSSEVALYFVHGIAGSDPVTTELISQNVDLIRPPTSLVYNDFNNTWYLATNDDSEQRAFLYERVVPGTWQGPYTIDQQTTGVSAKLLVIGLACRDSDGQLSAMVSEHAHGSTTQVFSVLYSDPDTISFGAKAGVNSFDTALFDSDWLAYPAETADGELALMVIRHLLGDPLLDVLMFTEDTGVWSYELWDSPVHKKIDWFTSGFTIMGNGAPAAALVEYDGGEALFGRVFVYYPW